MRRVHPGSVLLLGLAVLLAGTSREGAELIAGGTGLLLIALIAAPAHLRALLSRSRWLLLTMLAMFGWLTPGTPLPNVPGATQEGLLLAAENLARLLIALSAVALILKTLTPAELVAGLRSLLAPLVLLGIPRDRIAVRLALTLSEVEASRNAGAGAPEQVATSLSLPASALGATDLVLGAFAALLVIAAWLT